MSETGQHSDTPTVDDARQLLREVFGHEDFRDGQADVVASALAGGNLLVVMPTGSGKSLLYQLPALLAEGLTLVVSPLIALMKDQVDELTRRAIAAAFINSSLSIDEQQDTIRRCVAGEIRLLYVAPERFRSASFLRMLEQVQIARLAVDEAHCISEWGHDFRPDYRRIKQFRQQMGNPIVTALTATATPRVQQDIIAALGLAPDEVDIHVRGFDRPNLNLNVVRTRNENEKIAFLRDFIRAQKGAGIIYVGTRKAAEELTVELQPIEPSVTMYHAGLDGDQRARAQEVFLEGKARIAVATVAFGMGIDKADVRFVVHYHFPGSVEQYYQEIGRAGRDGLPSQCVLLYASGDRFLRQFFIDLSYPSREQVASVMDAIYRIDANPVMLTHKQIAEYCDEPIKDGQVGAAVRLLASAGVAQPLEGTAMATVTLDRPGAAIVAAVRGKVQRSVLEALAIAGDLETPGDFHVDLDQLAAAASLTVSQVQRALGGLDAAGHVAYHPPFRGRGVQKLIDAPPPFEQVRIDWETQDFLRGLEEEKLQVMESYIHSRSCRRAFIVKYFGEKSDMICGECDTCRSGEAAAAGDDNADKGILGREPNIAQAVLLCVYYLRFPLGASRTAQVVTGSRDSKLRQWGLTDNPAYGSAHCSQDKAREVIDLLMSERYLRRGGEYDRPVLELTDEGRRVAESIDPSELRKSAKPAPATRQRPSAVEQVDITQAALRCVADLSISVGVGRVAEVLTGSNAKWIRGAGADQLSVYNTVRMSQQKARDQIRELIDADLLRQSVNGRYPVLELTDAGQVRLGDTHVEHTLEPTAEAAPAYIEERIYADDPVVMEFDIEPPVAPNEPIPAEPTRSIPDAEDMLDRLIAQLLSAERQRAGEIVKALALFHPGKLAAFLSDHYESADTIARGRIVWATGELCGHSAIALLSQAAAAHSQILRTQAATALGKIAARGCSDAIEINRHMGEIHRLLQALLSDNDAEVSEAAATAARRLTNG